MPIDPTRRTDTPRDYYDFDSQTCDAPPAASPSSATAPPTTSARRSASLDDAPDPLGGRSHGRASADFVRRANASSASSANVGSTPRSTRANDGVIYLGMNSTGGQNANEAKTLAQSVRRGTEVDVVGHGENDAWLGADQVRVKGPGGTSTVADLDTPEGVQTFVSSLKLSPERSAAVADVLTGAIEGSRDELAGLATILARGERGEPMPARLVISGHSTGPSIYDGNDNKLGEMRLDSVKSLARALPGGASKIDDLMISACNSGYDGARAGSRRTELSSWKDAFPNLKTAWGYGSETNYHSPSGIVAQQHVANWEHATRGNTEHLGHQAARVSTWTTQDGYTMGSDR